MQRSGADAGYWWAFALRADIRAGRNRLNAGRLDSAEPLIYVPLRVWPQGQPRSAFVVLADS
ncbi:hypothetical protein D3C76_1321630 [compost metagenome]